MQIEQDTQTGKNVPLLPDNYPSELLDTADRLITFKQVTEFVPLKRTTLWHMEKEGAFPRRRTYGNKRSLWLLSEIQDWIKNLEPVPLNKSTG